MKINELIRYVKGQKKASPVCAFDDEMICIWINEIEGMVQSEILLLSPADTIVYSLPDDGEKELLVPAPHSKIYRAYVIAMMEFSGGEYSRYDNTMALFNQWWNEYAAWYAQNIDPASGKGEFKGYYVSAYAIAVKHGYKGSEEDWLSELDLRVKAAEKHADDSAAAAASAMVAVTKYPMIGEDGYWKVWDTVSGEYVSTGIKAEGKPGDPFEYEDFTAEQLEALRGDSGKSAYEYARAGGYEGSEEEFYDDLGRVHNAGGGAPLSDELPLMNGEASAGVSEEAARIDHVHPRDTGLMPAMNQMNIKVTPNETDRFPYYDNAVKTMVYTTFARFLSALKKSIDTVKNAETAEIATKANALIDASGVYTAVLPEGMTEDGILALQSDIVKALVGYATEEYVKGYAQEKGEYQPAGEYLVPTDLSEHNTSEDSHNDIRLLIDGLTARLNALADSDDDTLDQLSEVVEYIKANRGLIESVTTSKVNVADIIDNLVTNVSNKPLSAAQGVELKKLIDAITVPTKLSELSGDSTHRTVTDAEKAAWNAKSNFSGNYADLEGKPTIPTVPTKVSAFENDAGYVTNDKTITITGVDENGNTHTWTVYGVKS